MGILDNDNHNPPSKEQRQENTKIRVQRLSQRTIEDLKKNHQRIYDLIWNHNHLTPQEVLDGFGTDAAELFNLSNILLNSISQANPDDPYPGNHAAPKNYQINDDGTVTITD